MVKFIWFLLLLVGCYHVAFSQTPSPTKTWQTLGPPGFSDGQAYDINLYAVNGTPMVSFLEHLKDGQRATAMRFDGAQWVVMATFDLSSVRLSSDENADVILDKGVPFVATLDSQQEGKFTVRKWVGNNWVKVGPTGRLLRKRALTNEGKKAGLPEIVPEPVEGILLNVDQGTPYVSLEGQPGESEQWDINFMKYDGSRWIPLGWISDAGLERVILDQGIPYYPENGGIDHWTGTEWKPAFPTCPLGVSGNFRVDHGIPYVASSQGVTVNDPAIGGMGFGNPDGTPSGKYSSFKVIFQKYEKGLWRYLGRPGRIWGPYSVSIDNLLLFIDQGTPYVAFGQTSARKEPTVLKYTWDSWVPLGDPKPGPQGWVCGGATVPETSFWVEQGTPYLAFSDKENGGKLTVLVYRDAPPIK